MVENDTATEESNQESRETESERVAAPLPTSGPELSSGPSARRRSLASEFLEYLLENKKWWMIPIILVIVILGLLLIASGSAVAPFIYALI